MYISIRHFNVFYFCSYIISLKYIYIVGDERYFRPVKNAI